MKADVVRVTQVVSRLSDAWDRKHQVAGPGGMGSTRDYFPDRRVRDDADAFRWLDEVQGVGAPVDFEVRHLQVEGPHEGDPIFAEARDVGYDMKIQDPDDCQIWAWNWPFDLDVDELREALWVQLVVCRAGFEGNDEWEYSTFLVKGEDEYLETESGGWPEVRQVLEKFLVRAAGAPAVDQALDVINVHRRQLGMSPLDPQAAGWSGEDVILEAQRVARLPNLGRLLPP